MDIRSTRLFKFWEKYEHHIGVGALLTGFVFDLIIADRPDSIPNNILLLSYLFIAGAFIIILNLRERRRTEHSPEPLFLLLILQFCFGGLASNLLVLYGRSGTLAGSALFVGLLILLIVGNEWLRSRYATLRFNIAVYYFLLLTYVSIAAPTFIFRTIGNGVFLLSGLLSLAYIAGFLAIIFFAVFRGDRKRQLMEIGLVVGLIYLVFNGLYFLNVIPPVPLALREIGIYHSVLKRTDGSYLGLYEKASWYQFWRETSARYSVGTSQSAFCFSSVFAPSALKAPIYHKWEHKNAQGEWEVRARVAFAISGGRDEGYRGFTVKSNLEEGDWRCSVETASGALIGRQSFEVVAAPTPELSQKTL